MPLHLILRLYVSYSFEAFQFYEIEYLIFAPHAQYQSSTSYGFPYHSVSLSFHTGSPYYDPTKFPYMSSNESLSFVNPPSTNDLNILAHRKKE